MTKKARNRMAKARGSLTKGRTIRAPAVGFEMRAVRVVKPQVGQVLAEFVEAVHFERQVGQVRLDLHRAAGRKIAQFDLLFACRGLQKDQLRAAWRLVPADFFQTNHLGVESDRPLQIVDSITGVQQFFGLAHLSTITRNLFQATAQMKTSNFSLCAPRRLPIGGTADYQSALQAGFRGKMRIAGRMVGWRPKIAFNHDSPRLPAT